MKITAAQLRKNLQSNPLPAVIWISGDEPLLVLEACDEVRSAARNAGISERTVFEVDAKFDGADLIAANQSVSLFGDRECIELRLSSKLTDKARKALVEYINTANPDNMLLVVSGRIEASQAKAKWFTQVTNAGWWVPLWPIESNQMFAWLKERINRNGLNADDSAVSLLADRTDGNLLAAKQEIEKLVLIADGDMITSDTIMKSVSDSSRYTVFDLSSAFLSGNLERSLKIANGLHSEGVEAPIVLWLLTRELRLIVELCELQSQGQSVNEAFKRMRIFDKRQNDYLVAIRRAPVSHYQKCLVACAQIDSTIKGQLKGDPWLLISEMMVAICTPALPAYSFY